MNWYIGQEIVAIVNAKNNEFKIGDEFIIRGLKNASCRCNKIWIDIGRTPTNAHSFCRSCGTHGIENHGIAWAAESCFAPKQTLTESEEAYLKEFIEEVDSIPVENLFS